MHINSCHFLSWAIFRNKLLIVFILKCFKKLHQIVSKVLSGLSPVHLFKYQWWKLSSLITVIQPLWSPFPLEILHILCLLFVRLFLLLISSLSIRANLNVTYWKCCPFLSTPVEFHSFSSPFANRDFFKTFYIVFIYFKVYKTYTLISWEHSHLVFIIITSQRTNSNFTI